MMTKDEIKKGLEMCAENMSCEGCPYDTLWRCFDKIKFDAIALVTEQEKDIKQLKTECALLDDELRIARQNTINVLNELKSKSYVNNYCREVVEVEKIDEVIKEIEK